MATAWWQIADCPEAQARSRCARCVWRRWTCVICMLAGHGKPATCPGAVAFIDVIPLQALFFCSLYEA